MAKDDDSDMKETMGDLSKNMHELVKIFKTASVQMEAEDQEQRIMSKQLGPLMEKIDMLIDQNRKIAKGIVTVADMMAEQQARHQERHMMQGRRDPVPPPPPPPMSMPRAPPTSAPRFPDMPPAFPSNPFDDIPPLEAPGRNSRGSSMGAMMPPPNMKPSGTTSPSKKGLFGL